jgi:D-ribose pyranose/furanose isomerase RbsD
LAQQMKKLRLENQFKQNQIDNIIATDPEIQSMRKKIEVSYVSKERAKQLAERQVRVL